MVERGTQEASPRRPGATSPTTPTTPTTADESAPLAHTVGRHERRKLWARRNAARSVFFGFGLFGIVGWSVVLPTVGGALAGWALDRHYPGGRSWTLALLIAGLAVGCAVAGHWVARELDLIGHTGEPDDE